MSIENLNSPKNFQLIPLDSPNTKLLSCLYNFLLLYYFSQPFITTHQQKPVNIEMPTSQPPAQKTRNTRAPQHSMSFTTSSSTGAHWPWICASYKL